MAAAFEDLLAAHGPPGVPLRGVGTGIPGPVDPATGRVVAPSRMPGWNNFPVAERLGAHFDLPVLVENDANLMAAGEARAWPKCETLMVLKAGSGIGCGVIVNGTLHRGRAPPATSATCGSGATRRSPAPAGTTTALRPTPAVRPS